MAGFTRSSTFAEEIKARHPQADAAFTSGVTSVFSQWTALELAVVHGGGGTDSKKKADALLDDVLELFTGPKRIYKDVSYNLICIVHVCPHFCVWITQNAI